MLLYIVITKFGNCAYISTIDCSRVTHLLHKTIFKVLHLLQLFTSASTSTVVGNIPGILWTRYSSVRPSQLSQPPVRIFYPNTQPYATCGPISFNVRPGTHNHYYIFIKFEMRIKFFRRLLLFYIFYWEGEICLVIFNQLKI